jgi:predicted cupin superfamily sugar epimerase
VEELIAAEVIGALGLVPLPGEGGYYRQTYRAAETVETPFGFRPAGTAIYYLLTPDTYSALHRLRQDEVFHFYCGGSLEGILLPPGGGLTRVTLGPGRAAGETLQYVVPAGVWQGWRLAAGGKWGLVGTTVAPGFEFADMELATRTLLDAHPEHREALEGLLPKRTVNE